jgi:Lon protease-like protein
VCDTPTIFAAIVLSALSIIRVEGVVLHTNALHADLQSKSRGSNSTVCYQIAVILPVHRVLVTTC